MRDVKIAEATFTVLTEQVKSQSLAAGFKPDTFKVFSYANQPLHPSSPNILLLLILGAVLGFFLGCISSLFIAARKGVFYTKSSLISESSAALVLRSNTFRRIAKFSPKRLMTELDRRKRVELDEVEISLATKNVIYVLNAGGKIELLKLLD